MHRLYHLADGEYSEVWPSRSPDALFPSHAAISIPTMSNSPPDALTSLPPNIPNFAKGGGFITAIAQDATTGEVLMVASMNEAAFAETLSTGRAVYFSRSRNRLWRKGEESGNVQHVRGVFVDCDADAVLLKVEQVGGAACHEGYASCFFRQLGPDGLKVVAERVFDPDDVYGKR